jgi:hypothetical protein
MPVPPGYRLAVINPDGQILDTIDLEGFDLTRSAAAAVIALDIFDIIPAGD